MKKPTSRAAEAFAILAAAILSVSSLSAADLKSVRVEQGPRIDGRLDDPAWKLAPAIDGFRMVEPRPGEDPSEKTEAWIVYDSRSLYIGVYCHDSEPGRISRMARRATR